MRFAEGEPIPAITGTGAGLPDNSYSNDQIAEKVGAPARAYGKIMSRVGIESRHQVIPGEQTSSELASIAARQAMEMAGIDPEKIRSLVVGTSSPDHISVSAASMMQLQLGLRDDVRIYDIGGNACVGFLQSLRTSFADLTSPLGDGGPQLVSGVEVLTPMTPDRILKGIFGDGGGTVVTELVTPDKGAPTSMGFSYGADGRFSQDLLIPAGGSKLFSTPETIAEGQHNLFMNGPVIKDQAIMRMAQMTRTALAQSGMPIEEVAYFIPHQANLEIIQGVADELNFPMEKVVVTIDHTGNTSAGSIPIALNESVRDGRVKRNDFVLFAAFGAGLEYAAAAIPMVGLPRSK